jgi:hypothetical protein
VLCAVCCVLCAVCCEQLRAVCCEQLCAVCVHCAEPGSRDDTRQTCTKETFTSRAAQTDLVLCTLSKSVKNSALLNKTRERERERERED